MMSFQIESNLRTALIAIAALSMVAASSSTANAAEPKFDHVKISPSSNAFDQKPAFRVQAVDGKWVKVRSDTAFFPVRLDVKMDKGWIVWAAVAINQVLVQNDNAIEPNWEVNNVSGKSSFKFNATFANPGNTTPLGLDKQPVNLCNNLLSQGKKPDREHKIAFKIPMALAVRAARGGNFSQFDSHDTKLATAQTELDGTIVCEKAPQRVASEPLRVPSEPERVPGPPIRIVTPKVSLVQIGAQVSPGKCPKTAKLTVWLHTNGEGYVPFFFRQAGGGKSATYNAKAVKGAAGKFIATYTRTFQIAKATDTKYMAEVAGQGKISNWVPVKEKCVQVLQKPLKNFKLGG